MAHIHEAGGTEKVRRSRVPDACIQTNEGTEPEVAVMGLARRPAGNTRRSM